ncbi:tRNA (adenosine(37)-N6)-threonylcarbamoyltransferase complex dimerization subunit type 1 TsaB [Rhizobium straminoryzae]|uniref:tRNA (Adenosine(37)-N6)-threonylcarbamoyltransferase complex dimerization subunit type 1 TsaB n=1 Tax=Rhizobium straminoryzae TaxID=1387186 RepID=A0A549TH32_9HYPH|nr:tRNA (adenosine(37)-N6)-threonylcarbamoyltransferase complex dimerization subunit type 1 TsaB [Rhizobium straminoryzae]TRL42160.1 tRNA (adenosine(37)-N6)-threonylcarbamoyltransferase complex dimerization subunit type 1 TsaB [Rhizobium straminoryzae]
MKILAIDTAGVDCSAAVLDASTDVLLASVTERIGKGHAERLMAMIEEVLATAGLSLHDLDRVAVTIGPGSFTGIRVGVAAARGLALALGIPSVGVTTLEALAQSHLAAHPGEPVIAAMDAKRDEIYAQAFDGQGEPLGEPAILTLEGLSELAARHGAAVIGTAAVLVSGLPASGEPDRFDIAMVARIGAKAKAEMSRPKPLYLRGPDAKPQDGFALARA